MVVGRSCAAGVLPVPSDVEAVEVFESVLPSLLLSVLSHPVCAG